MAEMSSLNKIQMINTSIHRDKYQQISNQIQSSFSKIKIKKISFKLTFSRKGCIPGVYYCEFYSKANQNFCTTCIDGYVLSEEDNFCYRTVDKCYMFNYINNTCKKCPDGYQLSNNVCLPRPCVSGEYLDSSSLCTKGNITNCLEYFSPSGECEICKPSFTLIKNECLPEPTCPKPNDQSFWILKYGKCVEVTAGCMYIMDDGCGACEDEYYLYSGKCISLKFLSGLLSVGISLEDGVLQCGNNLQQLFNQPNRF